MSGLRIVLGVSAIALDAVEHALDLFTDAQPDRIVEYEQEHGSGYSHDLSRMRALLAHAIRLSSDLEGSTDAACATSASYATITLTGSGARDALYVALCEWIDCDACRVEDGDGMDPETLAHAHRRLTSARDLAKRVRS